MREVGVKSQALGNRLNRIWALGNKALRRSVRDLASCRGWCPMIDRVYPGVYVTEMPSGVKPIEGVSTSTGAENLHPGVFVEEVPFSAKPIEGVPTSPYPPAPLWTDHHRSDPGVMQLDLFAWIADGLLTRAQSVDADSALLLHRDP